MRVMTVLGPVDPEELGITLPHDHIFIDMPHSTYGFDVILNDVDLAIEELRFYKGAGGGTIVDVTPEDLGRNVPGQKRVAEETGLHVIAGTGYFVEPYYPSFVYEMNINRLADHITREVTKGIDGTGVRAGIIGEIGTGRKFITPVEERVFRAAARTHRRTGIAITTHTRHEDLLLEQIEILEDEGVDLHRVVIGHLGDQRNMERLRVVAAKGVYLGIDHIGWEIPQRDFQRARTVALLVREGYLSQILLSMDVCQKSRLHWHGGHGYDHVVKTFVPLLMKEGVSESAIRTMLTENPRRLLAFDV